MPKTIEQAGVIPVRDGRVCVISSSNGLRWVIPKGMIDPGHSPAEAATIEAWEEAGLIGAIHAEPVGRFEYEKNDRPHRVTVFRMDVTEALGNWPERFRRREWLLPEAAALRIREPELRAMILATCDYALAGA
jgi:8-oxo-dGTP pyrophosphatase MutT (NUDIX family)